MAKSLVLLSSLWASSLADCPSGTEYDSTFNRCYKYVSSPAAFFIAEQSCVADGGHLASIQNGFENAMVAETVQNTPGMSNKNYWIGANLLMSSNWSWSDGTPFSYTNWAVGEPNGTSQCGSSQAGGGLWKTISCTQAQPYVCVIPGDAAATQPPPCPTPGPHVGYCQTGWTYFDQTDFCYKVDYYHWAPGQPDNNQGKENCVQIYSDELSGKGHSGLFGDWNDINCADNMRALVCKKAALHN